MNEEPKNAQPETLSEVVHAQVTSYAIINTKTQKWSPGGLKAMNAKRWHADPKHAQVWHNIADIKIHLRRLLDWNFDKMDNWMLVEFTPKGPMFTRVTDLEVPERRAE